MPHAEAHAETRSAAAADGDTGPRAEARPELTPLDDAQRKRVRRVMRRQGAACPACGNRRRLRVGDALYLGFLFLDEETDAYMVAVTCERRGCPRPRTGIRLHAGEFLEP